MKKVGRKIIALLLTVMTLFICLFSSACSSVSKFAIVYNGNYIYSDASGIKIRDSATFMIKPYGGDDYIEVKAQAIKIDKEYNFGINQYSSYGWNYLIGVAKVNVGNYLDITIDQDANTVTINNTTADAIVSYANYAYTKPTVSINPMPTVDMFRIDIYVGEAKMSLKCSILHNVQGIELKPSSNKNLQVR